MAIPLEGESYIKETPAITGLHHTNGIGVLGKSQGGKAGSFEGDVEVTGQISAKDFLPGDAQPGAPGLAEQIATLVVQVGALKKELMELKAGFHIASGNTRPRRN